MTLAAGLSFPSKHTLGDCWSYSKSEFLFVLIVYAGAMLSQWISEHPRADDNFTWDLDCFPSNLLNLERLSNPEHSYSCWDAGLYTQDGRPHWIIILDSSLRSPEHSRPPMCGDISFGLKPRVNSDDTMFFFMFKVSVYSDLLSPISKDKDAITLGSSCPLHSHQCRLEAQTDTHTCIHKLCPCFIFLEIMLLFLYRTSRNTWFRYHSYS